MDLETHHHMTKIKGSFCNENMFEHLRILEDLSHDDIRKTKYTFMPLDGHPTELGQKTWAQYLYNYIKEKNIL